MKKLTLINLFLCLSFLAQEKDFKADSVDPIEQTQTVVKEIETKQKITQEKVVDSRIAPSTKTNQDPFKPLDKDIDGNDLVLEEEDPNAVPKVRLVGWGYKKDGTSIIAFQINDDLEDILFAYDEEVLSLNPLPYEIQIQSITKKGVKYKLERTKDLANEK